MFASNHGHDHEQPHQPTQFSPLTLWTYRSRKRKCPHLEDLTPQASKICALKNIGQGGHSRVVQVEMDGRVYALRLVR